MKRATHVVVLGLVMALGLVTRVVAADCPDDSVRSGTVCMDKYEASVWYVLPQEKQLIAKIRDGKATLADLTAGGSQLGLVPGDLADIGCPATGNGCVNVYAVSIPGVTPSAGLSWFQAAAAARNSLKRLPTNQEWQVAALGTPDTVDDGLTTCAIDSLAVGATGSRGACVSDVGAFDMVGNLWEWVADWGDLANGTCTFWPGDFGSDISCVGGPGSGFSNLPGALLRGGNWDSHAPFAGVFAVNALNTPSSGTFFDGFRCAR